MAELGVALVLTMSDKPADERYELITVVLTDLGDGRTEMRFEQCGHMRQQYEAAKSGRSGFCDRVAEVGRSGFFDRVAEPRAAG